ncbi:MAG TPA: PQQ-binding-like beta-propeller repeat protein [Verrucomicrobiae bacterium]|jgi:hypothetical protein|nr:PQQ-binding-like beta-propeller repeat protein [Verrucomicrobiae bacterium]
MSPIKKRRRAARASRACAAALAALCGPWLAARGAEFSTVLRSSLVTNLADAHPAPTDWPWWRGITRDNKAVETEPPLHWSSTSNVVWKASLPGRGHASPILWGDRIFLATADETAATQSILCLERSSGRQLWQTQIHQGGFLKKHDNNSHASATPACDGERVYFPSLFDNALWVTAVNLQGQIVWQKKVGDFISSNGYGSSPVLYKSLVIVVSDNVGDACLEALNRATGEVAWRVERPKLDNFCTPTLGDVCGRPQLLLCGSKMVASYDPATGGKLWFFDSPTEVAACTMAFGTNLVVGSGNVPVREMICARADGSGNVTATHSQWRSKKNVTYVPSPLIDGQRLYFVNDGGIAYCLDLPTGDEIWKERLGGDFFSSPVLCAGRIYIANHDGVVFVLRASDNFEVLAKNDLAEESFSSPVICGQRIYLRTAHTLFAIGNTSP